jgi:DNA-directed RNA polymerase specialized sigma24 family protein
MPLAAHRTKPFAVLSRCWSVGHEELDFASFYEASRDDCLRTVLASVGDMETAQDMVAEAFARAWASWRKVSRHPAPRAWVVRTALNAGVSSWRKRRRDQPLPADGAAVGGLPEPMGRELMAALLRLPVRQRQVIALRIILDLDTNGTATVLGIAPGTVKAHLSQGLATLRSQLTALPEQRNS